MEEVKQKKSPQEIPVSPVNTSLPVIQTPTPDKDVKTTALDNKVAFDFGKLTSPRRGEEEEEGMLLGSGADAYVVRGTYADKPVAIKHFKPFVPTAAAKAKNKLKHEATVTASLPCDYLAPVLEYSLDPPLIVMELFPTNLVALLMEKSRKLSWLERYRLALDIALGIATLRYHGLLHRDIKSQNILIDADGRARLGDFGSTLKPIEIKGKIPTTPIYTAPEFIDKGTATFSYDVYSFGILLCEIATCRTAGNDVEFMFSIRNALNANCRKIPAFKDVPQPLTALIYDCCAKDPDKRPSIDIVAQRLEELWQKEMVNDTQKQQQPEKKEEKSPSFLSLPMQFFPPPKPEMPASAWVYEMMLKRAHRLLEIHYPLKITEGIHQLPKPGKYKNIDLRQQDWLRTIIQELEAQQDKTSPTQSSTPTTISTSLPGI